MAFFSNAVLHHGRRARIITGIQILYLTCVQCVIGGVGVDDCGYYIPVSSFDGTTSNAPVRHHTSLKLMSSRLGEIQRRELRIEMSALDQKVT